MMSLYLSIYPLSTLLFHIEFFYTGSIPQVNYKLAIIWFWFTIFRVLSSSSTYRISTCYQLLILHNNLFYLAMGNRRLYFFLFPARVLIDNVSLFIHDCHNQFRLLGVVEHSLGGTFVLVVTQYRMPGDHKFGKFINPLGIGFP